MQELQTSLWRFYSMGIIAANKEIGSHTAQITPIEIMNMSDGELDQADSPLEGSGTDGLGQSFSITVSETTAVPAKWLPFGSNRVTPPDVRRGERVMLWQFADEDKFWWTTTGLDEHLRRLETVVFAVSNESDPEKDIEALTPDNSYYVEFNTHTKQITLATNKNDGEPFAFTFQFNAKQGIVTLADDDNNFFEFNSRDVIMTMQNKYNTVVQLDNETINLFSNKDINLKTDTMNVTATTINYKATTINTNATNITTKCDKQTITATAGTKHIGEFTNLGAMTVQGGFAMMPAPGSTGPVTCSLSGNVNMGAASAAVAVELWGTFKVNGVSMDEKHQHAGDGGAGSSESTGGVLV